jgi:glycosyltransferase involved in cell wall biosynthesis
MVVPEAMACGLPVIATSASGEIGERVSDGVNGFIVPPADSDVLRDRMLELAENAALRSTMREKSRRRVEGQSPDSWAEAFEAAVARTLELPKRRFGAIRHGRGI